jgi:hypothetical protein
MNMYEDCHLEPQVDGAYPFSAPKGFSESADGDQRVRSDLTTHLLLFCSLLGSCALGHQVCWR